MGEDPSTGGPTVTGARERDQTVARDAGVGHDAGVAHNADAGERDLTVVRDPEQIRAEIDATREELGDTIEALAEKTDVKAHAKHKIEGTKATISEKKDELLGKTDELVAKAKEASPDTAVNAASQATQKARENPVPLALVGVFALGFLLGRVTAR